MPPAAAASQVGRRDQGAALKQPAGKLPRNLGAAIPALMPAFHSFARRTHE